MSRPLRLNQFFLDPYVKLELLENGKRIKKRKSDVKKRTLNPVFNESFIFDVSKDGLSQVAILLTVFDYDRFVHFA